MKLVHVRTMAMGESGGLILCVRCGAHAPFCGVRATIEPDARLVQAFRSDHASCVWHEAEAGADSRAA